jgi:hypothetical protein
MNQYFEQHFPFTEDTSGIGQSLMAVPGFDVVLFVVLNRHFARRGSIRVFGATFRLMS